jgi:PQQ-dependent dehydrogenase (s-GDH family)
VNRKGKLSRYTYNPGTQMLGSPIDILTNLPAGSDHLSFRLIFGPDQKLYFTIGDQGSGWLQNYCNVNRAQELPTTAEVRAQDWTKYQGKVLRLNLDGTIPSDNPTLAGVRSHIYSYGHRNAEGLVFGPDGKLYSSEHGPNTDDEVNLIEAGKNYGWPDVAGYNDDKAYVYADWSASSPAPCTSLRFNATAIPASVPQKKESTWSHPDFKPPIKTFFTVANGYDFQKLGAATIAPGSADIYTAKDGIPGWANSLLVLSLKLGKVYRLKLSANGSSVTGEATEHFKSTNRYRDIAIHPNSRTLYLSTDNSGRSTDASGQTTQALENPGAILEFSYRSR